MKSTTQDSELQSQLTSEVTERDRRLARVFEAADSVNIDDIDSVMSLTKFGGSWILPRSLRAGDSKLTSAMSSTNPSVIHEAAAIRDRVRAFDPAKLDSLMMQLQELRRELTEYQTDARDVPYG